MSTPASPELDALRAALAGRYRIEHELGAGGMAVVYRARDLERGRDVALKVLREDLGYAAGADRFDREIRVAGRLVHPHILPVLDSGSAAGRLWYTMPFVEGETLRARLEREVQLPVGEAVRLTVQVADALAHAHAGGILHRDVKPENILLAAGHALLADFGIARALGDTADRLTGTGIALGTPGYMSPEQSSGEQALDPRSDQYSLASVAYEMLAGEPPFTGPTAQAVIARRLSQPAPSLRTIRPGVPEGVDAALRRALSPVPADRYTDTMEFAQSLSAGVTAESGSPAPAPVRRRAGIAAVVLLLVIVGMWALLDRPAAVGIEGAAADGSVRLAVLPFRLIGDSADRYLAEGITEEVTSALSNLGGLRVLDRGSVNASAGSLQSAREIGAALRADALVDGDVQKAGDAIRVRVRLIDAASEESKWSQTFNHTSRDVFQVQSEVATRVAGLLRIQLAERESRTLRRPPTTNPAAYDAYLHARALERSGFVGQTVERVDSLIRVLGRAVELDSTFARAWAGLGEALVSSVFLFDAGPARLDRADSALRTALRLDSTVALAWKARGDLVWNAVRGWHFRESLGSVRHAIALQPSLTAAHASLGSLYFHYGFMPEARRSLETSLSLDPGDGCDDPTRCAGFSRPRVARVLWYEQKFDSALAVYESTPFLGGFAVEKAIVLAALGRASEGLGVLDSLRTSLGDNADRMAARALMHAALSQERQALALVRTAIAAPNSRSHAHHAQFTIACTYARIGRKAEAVEWLQRTAENGMPNYPLFRNDPNLESLQGDPGYETLMAALERQYEANAKLVRGPST